jgi:hypothetical protein
MGSGSEGAAVGETQENWDWTAPEIDFERSIDERFAIFCAEHPDVLAMFRRFATELRDAGHKKAGAKLIWERLRWERLTSAHGAVCPALNNDFTSRLARWLVSVDPGFEGFFETRVLKSRGEE